MTDTAVPETAATARVELDPDLQHDGDGPATGLRIVQRTIIRADQELDIRPLYITGVSSFSAGESTSRQSGRSRRLPAVSWPPRRLTQ